MLDQAQEVEEDLDNEQKKEKKEREKAKEKDGDEDGISKDFLIRAVVRNPVTGSLYLVSELSKFETWTSSYYDGKTWRSRTIYRYTNSDLLVISTNPQGQIDWINTLPKKQVEQVTSSGYGMGYYSPVTDYFARGGGMPFYSSFSLMLRDNKMFFLINDHVQNGEVKKLGDKTKMVSNFRKSVAYAVILDLTNGQFSRKLILSNEDDPVLMPRFSYVVDKDIFLPAMKMKALGKTEFKMGKITVK
jgi:hypothetical protein